MCTVSWIHAPEGYQLLCNRDEQDSRLRATAPQQFACDGVRFIAPIDGDFGGSWIAANEFGLTLALLNRSGFGARATRSRGLLVRELAGAESIEDLQDSMTGHRLSAFAGFALVALQPGRPAALFEWDSRQLSFTPDAEPRMPVTSSSFDTKGVEAERRHEFNTRAASAGKVDTELLFQFHQSHGLHGGRPSAYTTCMHRPGARTVSFTFVDVSATGVRMFYSPGPPCERVPGETAHLTLKAAVRA